MTEGVFYLNREVTFISQQRMLCRCDNRVEPIIFNTPSAKILLMLLTCEGVITQKALYEFAWNDNGVNTTPNNLYQNISLVRRGLNKIFMRNDDYVVTVPRKGFYFNPKIKIETSQPVEASTGLSLSGEDTSISDVEVTLAEKAPARRSLLNHALKGSMTKFIHRLPKKIHAGFALSLIFIISSSISGTMIWQSKKSPASQFFSRYSYYDSKDNCSFYFDMSSTNRRIKNVIINNTLRDCHTHPVRYVSWLKEFSAVSVIACRNEMSDFRHGDGCISYYYQGLLKNET